MIDLHTHSAYSDGTSTLEENLAAAIERGVTTFGASDHVRRDTTYLPGYVSHVSALATSAPIVVRCGVEAKMLDTTGALDVPDDLSGIEYIAIADHQVPTDMGIVSPSTIRRDLAEFRRAPIEVIEMLITATRRAARECAHQPYIAHLFSVLPKVGLHEDDVPAALVSELGHDLARAGAWVEKNAKWDCPGPLVLAALARQGVQIVSGSDAHSAQEVALFDRSTRTVRQSTRSRPVRSR